MTDQGRHGGGPRRPGAGRALGPQLRQRPQGRPMTAAGKDAAQSFYRGWASLWAQQASTELSTQRAAVDVHAPGQWRTNGPLINQPSYGEAFACKAGQPMQAKPDQRITIFP